MPVPGNPCRPSLQRRHRVHWPPPYRGIRLAKPNYSFEKRQREIAKKKQQDEKDARKREAREAAKAAADSATKPPGSNA